jgi:hypothetical protein
MFGIEIFVAVKHVYISVCFSMLLKSFLFG